MSTAWSSAGLARTAAAQWHDDALLEALFMVLGELRRVRNETGMGIVPLGALSRLLVDENGQLNQAVARLADRVLLTVAGGVLGVK